MNSLRSFKRSSKVPRAATGRPVQQRVLCPGSATWRHGMRARAALIVDHNEGKVLGPRFVRLLEEIHAQASVRHAALTVGVGYRHAIAWIRRAEQLLARPLVTRRAGGVDGGGAGLTREAVALVRSYRRLSRAIDGIVRRAERELLAAVEAARP
jgi:molybdate transport repressor ModE-like protein